MGPFDYDDTFESKGDKKKIVLRKTKTLNEGN
jgi:hypothetical protein